MKKKLLIIVSIVAVIIIVGAFLFIPKNRNSKKEFTYSKLERGDIKTLVSCTGTISAKGTVKVGTGVSGTVSKVFVDFNDGVKKNQVLAVLDTTLLELAVSQAEASLVKAISQYEYDLKNYENYKSLYEQKLVSDSVFSEAKVTKDASYASKLNSETELKRAKSNLGYATITSPIDGIVINRDIEEGQTVAASYSTPTLFTIALDLSNMQIKALVDENDIGKIRVGQSVNFTVESYPNETFSGSVVQIRLEPTTVSNVVNYYVMIDAKNNKKLLLPGMTATIDIVIEEKNDALLVQSSVLKFQATEEMYKEMRESFPPPGEKDKNFKGANGEGFGFGPSPDEMFKKSEFDKNKTKKENVSQLWFYDSEKRLKFVFVKTGITDGQKSEIVEVMGNKDNDKIEENLQVISGINSGTTTKKVNKNQMNRMGGPPPMF